MKISFYLEFNILNKINYICSNLDKIDDFYFERTVFSLTNFCIKYLIKNDPNNEKYLITYVETVFNLAKRSINNNRVIVCLNSLYSLNSCLTTKMSERLPKILVKIIATTKNYFEKDMSLDLILKFIIISSTVKEKLAKYLEYFYIQISDKE